MRSFDYIRQHPRPWLYFMAPGLFICGKIIIKIIHDGNNCAGGRGLPAGVVYHASPLCYDYIFHPVGYWLGMTGAGAFVWGLWALVWAAIIWRKAIRSFLIDKRW